MTDLTYIKDLLGILKVHGVSHVKMQGLEITFGNQQEISRPASFIPDTNDSIQNIVDSVKKQEEAMPPDLRADALMDQDKILNWSSPDQEHDAPPLPLTGEQDL